mmetsp:Transcript_71721/g.233160  ORF Transcript_71721/g.233160 Transcript_71721/m.233160 type:complete len:268 (+) Transcript_71721:1751-2554(+)
MASTSATIGAAEASGATEVSEPTATAAPGPAGKPSAGSAATGASAASAEPPWAEGGGTAAPTEAGAAAVDGAELGLEATVLPASAGAALPESAMAREDATPGWHCCGRSFSGSTPLDCSWWCTSSAVATSPARQASAQRSSCRSTSLCSPGLRPNAANSADADGAANITGADVDKSGADSAISRSFLSEGRAVSGSIPFARSWDRSESAIENSFSRLASTQRSSWDSVSASYCRGAACRSPFHAVPGNAGCAICVGTWPGNKPLELP